MSTSAVSSSALGTSSSSGSSMNGTQLIQGTSYTSGAGINVSETVAQILAADRAPEIAWTTDETNISAQQSALKTLQSQLSSIESAFQSLNESTGVFSGLTASSADSSVLSATAGTTATAGNYEVTVSNLASTGVSYSSAVSSASASIAAGTLTYTVGGGAAQTINIPASGSGTTTTLSAAASYINQQNLGVSASVITDASGARLVLTSTASGSAASVAVQSAPGGLTFTNIAGRDASLTVNGVPVDSASNTVSSAIPGVTLQLSGSSSSPIQVQVAADTAAVTTAINSFVSAYNAAISDLNSQFQVTAGSSSKSNTSGVLETDPTVRTIQSQLLSSIASGSNGNSGSAVKTMADMGITMNDDGTLSVNSTKLTSALTNNYSAVQGYFQNTSSSSFAHSFNSMISSLTDSTRSPIVLDLNSLQQSYTDDQDNIKNLEANLSDLQVSLTTKYSNLDALLQSFPITMDEVDTELGYNSISNTASGSSNG